MKCQHISIDSEICNGTPVFTGTRVFIETLFDYLENGETVADFLDDFPSVSKAQIDGILEYAKTAIVA